MDSSLNVSSNHHMHTLQLQSPNERGSFTREFVGVLGNEQVDPWCDKNKGLLSLHLNENLHMARSHPTTRFHQHK